MALNPNIILQGQPAQITQPDPMEQYGKALNLKSLLTQGQIQQQSLADDQAARDAYKSANGDPNETLKILMSGGNYKPAQALQKQLLETQKVQADLGKTKAETEKTQGEVTNQAIARHRDQLAGVNDPQSAAQWLTAGYNDPVAGKVLQQTMPLDQALQRIPTDPMLFQQWKQQAALGATKYIEMNKPTYTTSNLGGKTVTQALPGLGGPASIVSSQQNSVSPDAVLSANTSRANNASNIAKDYKIAGIGPDGNPAPSVEAMAQLIASGKAPPITGFALAKPQGQMVMSRVAQINPDYDATDYGAKQKAAKDFTSGTQGNAMRSFAVAGQHLDQLGQLADALNNGNMQIVNKIANKVSEQTGNAAPTNFDAAKDVVSKEVIKAIVGAGGGVTERQELAHLMSNVKSPAQLKGVIDQYRGLMSAQHDALLEQRRAAGLSDKTLPNYSEANGSPAPAAGSPTLIKTEADYNKLPSGATYIDPSGKTRKKQ